MPLFLLFVVSINLTLVVLLTLDIFLTHRRQEGSLKDLTKQVKILGETYQNEKPKKYD
jgi:hypothetical protein